MKHFLYALLGAAYATIAAGFALAVGGGLGHGTDFFGRVPLAPFSLPPSTFDAGSILPFLGGAAWALAFAAAAAGARTALGIAAGWLVIHDLSVAILFLDKPNHPQWPLLLLPYAVGQTALWVVILVRFVRMRSALGTATTSSS